MNFFGSLVMSDDYRTKEEYLQELEEMRRKVHEVDKCEIELRKAQEKYEKLLETAPDAMVFVNRDIKIVMGNAQFEVMFGYARDEIAGKDFDVLIPGRFHEKHRKHVRGYFANPRVRHMDEGYELYAFRKNGEEFPVDISLSFLHVDNEAIATAAIRDITKRKQMEEQVDRHTIHFEGMYPHGHYCVPIVSGRSNTALF